MVSTRSGSTKVPEGVERDDNRIIAVVTGANSGFGLGICQQLLSNLSLPVGSSIPASTPQSTAMPPSLRSSFKTSSSKEKAKAKEEIADPPATLTLILACRSQSKAEEAKQILLTIHEKDLKNRIDRGEKVRTGWKEGLRIEWQGLDLDNPGGGNGVLGFCERLKEKYPHVTTLYLNAGMGAFTGLDWWMFFKQTMLEGMIRAQSLPKYQMEEKGAMSSDGERGLVWGTNVLAPYIIVKELIPLLKRSPPSLPFQPRVIYTSSLTSRYSTLHSSPLNDYQLIDYPNSYSPSKYMGDLVMTEFDRAYGTTPTSTTTAILSPKVTVQEKDRPIRFFTVDPGCVCTNFFSSGMGVIMWWANVKFFFYWLSFYLCRLLGSPHHPVYADQGALPMIYAALISDEYILPAEKNPAQRFAVMSSRWGKTAVGYEEVDRWEQGEDIGKGVVEACEAHRKEWRRRGGLE
ncbi:uncharacterized protein IL334_007612 [Kwoniella shivajii]|uniref:3-keto sterol reductase n=1 Tax=Kwoniella shivajii TaxID=564305 RepID=A0ABZ1D954_9TREE|nr:hypothetical protein IL334_007612 [Kwoniella shivajii]